MKTSKKFHSNIANLSYNSRQIPQKEEKHSKFTEKHKIIAQILKVLKLRLMIENIKIPNDKLIDIIKTNLNEINILNFEVKNLNLLVDDLMTLIKEKNSNDKEQTIHNKQISFGQDEEKKETFNEDTAYLDNVNVKNANEKTILSFNRKEYEKTNLPLQEMFKKHIPKKTKKKKPMKFSLGSIPKNIEEDKPFFKETKNGDIPLLNDSDLDEIQDKIIEEVLKNSKQHMK